MPFTPAHVVAVLPLLRRVPRRPGLITGLVVGSMAPDLPYFAPSSVERLVPFATDREATHSWPAAFTTTALIGIVAVLLWERFLLPPLRDAAPAAIRERLSDGVGRGPGPGLRDLPVVYAAVVFGILTHDVWDAFGHGDSWAVRALPALHDLVAGHPWWSWIQIVSSAVGVLVLLGWCILALRRRPAVPSPRLVPWAGRALAGTFVAGVLGALLGMIQNADAPLIDVVGWFGVSRGIGAFALATLVLAAAWWLSRRGTRSGSSPTPSGPAG